MKSVAVSELKASLSKYLARVKGGEAVISTERGKPVAKLIPLDRAEEAMRAHLRDLERRGAVRIGSGRIPDEFWDLPRLEDPEGLTLKALLEEREEGR